jgi:3-hydroxyisobutyrate dehydrogenase-like beta-hydroxyacid dehydrogenase
MGAAVGAVLGENGTTVLWAGEGRSRESHARAVEAGLTDLGSLAELVSLSDVVLSICPPSAALATARAVSAAGFNGLYVDANAVSPATAAAVAAIVRAARADYVDGGIIGPPPRQDGGLTRLFLSGPRAAQAAALFEPSPLGPIQVEVIDDTATSASALKMVFAAWSKGSQALLLAIRAAAQATGVEDALLEVWASTTPDVLPRVERAAGITDRAWRWVGEMEEISDTFTDAGLPGGFHTAAADVFARLERFKGTGPTSIDDVVAAVGSSQPAIAGSAP